MDPQVLSLRDEANAEFIDKCDDFEREVAREVAASHYTYAEYLRRARRERSRPEEASGLAFQDREAGFYGGEKAEEARRSRLTGCEAVLDDYAHRVFDAHDENK